MSYTVLARKWRPRNFAEMAGQQHVIRALVNALDEDRVHHAFLFTGTRGVGKTTIARILAKALNCEAGVSSSPCDNCSACAEIDEGRFVDLIEVDAASRTKVDDTRDLLDNVQYAPTRGRYKVYLIDEVHMLSRHSFNALLKTLEEPPPHVKFLLATTDPQKLPVTVLSRCLQFNLKRLTVDLIRERLQTICAAEKVATDEEALTLLARAADGSMRDGLSLLDQTIAFGGGQLSENEVRSMLGTVDGQHVAHLLEALAGGDAAGTIAQVAALDETAPDYAGVLDEVIALLQRTALVQVVPDALDDSRGDREQVSALAAMIAPEDLQLFYQIGLNGRRDLMQSPDARGGFEMILLRMLAFRPDDGKATPPPSAGKRPRGPAPNKPAARPQRSARAVADPPQPVALEAAPESAAAWLDLVARLELAGAARQLANNCTLVSHDANNLRLALDPDCEHLLTPQLKKRLGEALAEKLGQSARVAIEVAKPPGETPARRERRKGDERLQAARDSLESDPTVQALKSTFNASISDDSVKPLD